MRTLSQVDRWPSSAWRRRIRVRSLVKSSRNLGHCGRNRDHVVALDASRTCLAPIARAAERLATRAVASSAVECSRSPDSRICSTSCPSDILSIEHNRDSFQGSRQAIPRFVRHFWEVRGRRLGAPCRAPSRRQSPSEAVSGHPLGGARRRDFADLCQTARSSGQQYGGTWKRALGESGVAVCSVGTSTVLVHGRPTSTTTLPLSRRTIRDDLRPDLGLLPITGLRTNSQVRQQDERNEPHPGEGAV